MDSIKVYSLPSCGMCKLLKRELDSRGIAYSECQDVSQMEQLNISSVPVLSVNEKLLNFRDALAWVRSYTND